MFENDWIITMVGGLPIVSEYSLKCDTSNNDESMLTHTPKHGRSRWREWSTIENSLSLSLRHTHIDSQCGCVRKHLPCYEGSISYDAALCIFAEILLSPKIANFNSNSYPQIDFIFISLSISPHCTRAWKYGKTFAWPVLGSTFINLSL